MGPLLHPRDYYTFDLRMRQSFAVFDLVLLCLRLRVRSVIYACQILVEMYLVKIE